MNPFNIFWLTGAALVALNVMLWRIIVVDACKLSYQIRIISLLIFSFSLELYACRPMESDFKNKILLSMG